MRGKLRRHLNVPTVLSLLALFVSLGGVGYAASVAKKNSVTSKSIKNGQVKTADLANAAVTGSKLAAGSVSSGQIADGSVTTAKIMDGSVTTAKITDGSVTTAKITDGSVTGPKLAGDAVTSGNIADQSISAADLSPALTSSLKDGCPAGMTKIANTLCISQIAGGYGTWNTAVVDCAAKNLRLPSVDELYLVFTKTLLAPGVPYWTNSAFLTPYVGGDPVNVAVYLGADGAARVRGVNDTMTVNHACVTTPTDG